jgi:hypothetical protein
VEYVRVRLLGDVQVEGCDPARLGRRQARTLLKILALHHVMDALSQSGRSASALAFYAGFRARLADELGVSPSPETEAVHDSILLGTHQHAQHPPAVHPRQPALLPGRVDALSHFDALLDLAVGGRGQVSIVEGEAGIGKSTLLGAIGIEASERGFTVVSVAADEPDRSLPVQPLLDVVDGLIRQRAPQQNR